MTPITALVSPADIDLVVSASRTKDVLLLKHSTRCPISAGVLGDVQTFLVEEGGLLDYSAYVVDVLLHRDVSQAVAEFFGVAHESPQLLVIRDCVVVEHAEHGEIDLGWLRGLRRRSVRH
jgi:bacillithiol system protein YtxJ